MASSLETSPKLFSFQRQYKKLENSMCVVSYSIDYVEKYHIPLAKSLMEYSNRKDLRIKRAIIREPENLNSIPPSKVCTCIKIAQPLDIFFTFVFDWTYYGMASSVCLSVCPGLVGRTNSPGSYNLVHLISMMRQRCLLFFKVGGPRSRSYCHIVGKRCRQDTD